MTLLERSLEHDFDLWILPGVADVVASRVVTRSLGDLPLVPVVTRGASAFAFAWRRALDLVLGTALTLARAARSFSVVTAAVALESPGAPWIRQRRVGRGGRDLHALEGPDDAPGRRGGDGPDALRAATTSA